MSIAVPFGSNSSRSKSTPSNGATTKVTSSGWFGEMLTLYKSASSLESTQPRISASTSSPKSVDVATSSPTSAPVEASSCGFAHAFTPLPTVKVSSAMISLSVSLFSTIISSLSKTMKTLYSPSTIFVGIAPLIVSI